MCEVLDRVEKMGAEKIAKERNIEIATDLINAGQKDSSFIAKISKLSEEAVRELATAMGVLL